MNNGMYVALLLYYMHTFLKKMNQNYLVGYYTFHFYLILTVFVKSLKFNNNIIIQGDLKFLYNEERNTLKNECKKMT